MNKAAILEATLTRLHAQIAAADAKSNIVFAVDAAMLGLLAAMAPPGSKATILIATFGLLAGLVLIASLSLLAWAVFPRTEGPSDSLLYFGAIASSTEADYAARVGAADEAAYCDDLIAQCHRNGVIATIKYRWLQWAMKCMFLGLLLWLPAMFLFSRIKG